MGDLEVVTTADRPDLDEQTREALRTVWPEFIFHDPADTLAIMAAGVKGRPGTVSEWEDWTAMAFPETGSYVVPDALDLVEIDCAQDRGTYAETNLWMRHL